MGSVPGLFDLVVLLALDAFALMILASLDVGLLGGSDVAVGGGQRFPHEFRCARQRSRRPRSDTLLDARLLVERIRPAIEIAAAGKIR
jgi:hypothetical protein